MRRLAQTVAWLLILGGTSDLRPQASSDFILAAGRTGTVELIDATTLETVARLHFDFQVERLSPNADGSAIDVDGQGEGGPCCKHYVLDLPRLTLRETEPVPASLSPPWEYYGNPRISPDGRWRFELKSFRRPALKTYDLVTGAVQELIPPALPLTEEQCGGNWSAQGVWSGDRFYFYVACPNHPGFLWTILPGTTQMGTTQLGERTGVAPFAEVPGCHHRLPVGKALVAVGDRLLIYEGFGNKFDRTAACQIPVPGGAWVVDPATGQITRQVAAEFHFNRLIPNRSGSILYGVVPGVPGWAGLAKLVALDGQDYRVIKSRFFEPGVLQIAIGPLRQIPAGDHRILPPVAGRQ